MRARNLLFFFSFLLGPLILVAQESKDSLIIEKYYSYKRNNNFEFAILEVDKKLYYSDGVIHLAACVLDQYFLPTQLSEVLIVELLHEEGLFRKRFIFSIKKGCLSEYINIPDDIPTGNFQIVAYTRLMENFSLHHSAHRKSIYIQNLFEPTKKVAKGFSHPKPNEESLFQNDLPFEVNVQETESRINFEIRSKENNKGRYYLVAEGLGVIEFIAKLKINKKSTTLSFSKDKFSGSFQKVILLNDKLGLSGLNAFFIDYNHDLQEDIAHRVSSDSLDVEIKNNLLSVCRLEHAELSRGLGSLFERIYQLYYNVPTSMIGESLTEEQMKSKEYLSQVSGYSIEKWEDLLLQSEVENALSPQTNIEISGKVHGPLKELKEAVLAIHLFENDLDLLIPLDRTGNFKTEIFWPIQDDYFYYSIVDSRKDVSDIYTIAFDTLKTLDYLDNRAFFDKKLTDSLIESRREFNYVLSTFNEKLESETFSWKEHELIDRSVKVEDYVGIGSFEEFVKEAVMDLTVVSKKGKKSVNMYNTYRGKFDPPQMIVLNDKVLAESAPLFEIPMEEIESVNMIYSKPSLQKLSETFRAGVLIVLTKKPISIPDAQLDPQFKRIEGFYLSNEENSIIKEFTDTELFDVSSLEKIEKSVSLKNTNNQLRLRVETLLKNGKYLRVSKKMNYK